VEELTNVPIKIISKTAKGCILVSNPWLIIMKRNDRDGQWSITSPLNSLNTIGRQRHMMLEIGTDTKMWLVKTGYWDPNPSKRLPS